MHHRSQTLPPGGATPATFDSPRLPNRAGAWRFRAGGARIVAVMTHYSWMRFFAPDAAHRSLGLTCLGVGVQHGALPVVGPRTVDRHVAVMVSGGGGWFRRGTGPVHPVTAPALLWLTPGVPHAYGPDAATGWEETFVAFTGPATGTYTRLGYITPDRPVVPLSRTEGVSAVVDRVVRAARPGNPLADVEASVAVHELMLTLRAAAAHDGTAADGSVVEALARNAFLPLSVDGHAARLGMTPAGLRAAVRRAGGRRHPRGSAAARARRGPRTPTRSRSAAARRPRRSTRQRPATTHGRPDGPTGPPPRTPVLPGISSTRPAPRTTTVSAADVRRHGAVHPAGSSRRRTTSRTPLRPCGARSPRRTRRTARSTPCGRRW